MIGARDLQFIAQALTGGMLDSVVVGTMLAVAVAILLPALGRRDSSTGFAVWFSVLLTVAGLLCFGGLRAAGSGTRPAVTAITVPAVWALYALGIWAVVFGILLARVGVGLWQLRRLRSSCHAVDASGLNPLLEQTLRTFQKVRPVELYTSTGVQVPTLLGLLKPAVVLPAWALSELSAAELHAVVLHELAHLRRRDDWTNLVQKLVRALLFFHPAVWWIEARLTLEREMACDDAVLAETTNARAYAQCLVSVAEKSLLQRSLALAQAVVGRFRQMTTRINRILDANRPSATGVWKPALGLVGVLSMVCLLGSPPAGRLVGFAGPDRVVVQPATVTANPDARADSSREQSTRVVPAAWELTVTTLAVPHHGSVRRASAPARIQRRRAGDRMPQAAATGLIEQVRSGQTIFVVIECQQIETYGCVLGSARVLQFTINHPRAVSQNQGFPRKT